jgi:hypothetical protein
MMIQQPEILWIDGVAREMLSEPLTERLRSQGLWASLRRRNSAVQRNHVGTWELREGRLWLLDVEAATEHGPLQLETIFPGASPPILAQWFSGEIKIGIGSRCWAERGPDDVFGMHRMERVFLIEAGRVLADWARPCRLWFERARPTPGERPSPDLPQA